MVKEYHSHTMVDWWSIPDDRHKLVVNLLAGTEAGNYILEGGRVQGEGDSADLSAGLASGKETIANAICQRVKQPPRFEVYDIARDPGETVNLADDAKYRSVLDKLREELRTWRKETKDPFTDQSYLDKFTAAQVAKQKEIRAYKAEHGKGSFWKQPVAKADWSDLLHGTGRG